ncbi:uncharacterized protein LOC143840112 isoform X7 [Paroedura picta]|uniref:uncharacterized protein LOC143840112 isoform X7 n=1 Tax=Paroedura picta TaxID=143630 RepID=UPI004055AA42
MERGGWGRVSPPSSSRPKESRGSGSRPSRSAATRGRSPRRSSRVRSPSGGSGSRRGSEQRDGSLSRDRYLHRTTYCIPRLFLGGRPQFASRYSPNRHSSEEQNLRPVVDDDCYGIDPLEQRKQSDRE